MSTKEPYISEKKPCISKKKALYLRERALYLHKRALYLTFAAGSNGSSATEMNGLLTEQKVFETL